MVTPPGDPLADLLHRSAVGAEASGGFTATAPWVSRGAVAADVKVIAVLRGRAVLSTDGGAPVELEEGDAAVLARRSRLVLHSAPRQGAAREIPPPVGWAAEPGDRDGDGPGRPDTVVGGHLRMGPTGREPLLAGLPPLTRVRAAEPGARRIRTVLGLLLDEAAAGEAGAAFATAQYARLLALECLRAAVRGDGLPPGWPRLHADPRLRPAVLLLHGDPGRAWRLEELARAAAMSRTAFAERFRRTGGLTPFAYLRRWRVLVAEHALRTGDTGIGVLSARLGYASPGSFSTAFRRATGLSPSGYRRAHGGPPADPERPGPEPPDPE